jgi:Flp pilus assembly protein TadG
MWRFRQRFLRRAVRGQTLVLFALMSLTLIAGMGLVIDAGVNYAQRRNMQNAADTAALAGTRVISRVNTFSGTTRRMVWNAVKATAIDNGVADDPTLSQCVFVDTASNPSSVSCNTDVDGSPNDIIPNWAAGVQVRVSESHDTFFLRAVGIRTSGTSAASKAQVRAMAFMPTNDVVFAVCGVETMTREGTKSSILEEAYVEDWTLTTRPPSPTPVPTKTIATKDRTSIRNSAYKYDWNNRDGFGNPRDLGGPTFQLYSPTVADCDAQSGTWHGAILQEDGQDIQMQRDGAEQYAPSIKIQYGDALSSNSLEHAINGTLGCKAGQLPPQLPAAQLVPLNPSTDGCIMILPVLDNGNDERTRQNTTDLRGRVWGVFYVFNYGGVYYGQLVKNYPVHEDGENSWTQTYTGPITIALTKVNP